MNTFMKYTVNIILPLLKNVHINEEYISQYAYEYVQSLKTDNEINEFLDKIFNITHDLNNKYEKFIKLVGHVPSFNYKRAFVIINFELNFWYNKLPIYILKNTAIYFDKLHCIEKFMNDNNCKYNSMDLYYAAHYGNVKILQYLLTNGCSWNNLIFDILVEHKYLNCLIFVHENNFQIENCDLIASKYGFIEYFDYLQRIEYSFNVEMITYAVIYNHFDYFVHVVNVFVNTVPMAAYYESILHNKHDFFDYIEERCIYFDGINHNDKEVVIFYLNKNLDALANFLFANYYSRNFDDYDEIYDNVNDKTPLTTKNIINKCKTFFPHFQLGIDN